jgi:hypothetical protein
MFVELAWAFHLQFNMAALTANIGCDPVEKTILEDHGVRLGIDDDLKLTGRI